MILLVSCEDTIKTVFKFLVFFCSSFVCTSLQNVSLTGHEKFLQLIYFLSSDFFRGSITPYYVLEPEILA